jgi:WD40 repeat protein
MTEVKKTAGVTEAMRTGREIPVAPRNSPYFGLDYYDEKFGAWFFGREAEGSKIITNLRAARLTLLHAESGVGKSSLLRAGVSWRLRRVAQDNLARRGTPRLVPIVFASWKDDPVPELAGAIRGAITPYLAGRPEPDLPTDRLDKAIAAATDAVNASLLIMLDQFEEYFLYRRREPTPGWFADELARCINRPDLRANFLISIREDAYAGLGDLFKGRIANVYGNYLHVDYLDRASAEKAIRGPLDIYNGQPHIDERVSIEDELVTAVLDQVGASHSGGDILQGHTAPPNVDSAGDRVATPLLQLVMERLWDAELSAGSQRLRLETLAHFGGAQKIVRTHVGRALDGLAEDSREAAADILHHLVTPSGTKIALAPSDLAEYTGRAASETEDLLERLARSDTRILRPVPPPPGQRDGKRFEISHDLLAPAILEWGRGRRAARLEQQKEAAERQANDERRRARRFRALAIGSGALLVVVLCLLAWAVVLTKAAHRATSAANLAKSQAISAEVAGKSEELAQHQPVLAALLAAAAWRIAPTPEAHASLLNAVAQPNHGNSFATQGLVPLYSVAFSPNGEFLATAGADGSARLWDVQTRRRIHRFQIFKLPKSQIDPKPSTAVRAVAFSPNGEFLATAGDDGKARVFYAATSRLGDRVGGPFTAGRSRLTDVAFSQDGKILAAASADGKAWLWDVAAHRKIRTFRASHTGAVYSVAFSPDGTTLATAGADGKARLWDVATHRQIYAVTASRTAVRAVAFSPDGRTLATAGADGKARLWDVATHREKGAPLTVSASAVYSVAFSPDGKTVVTAGADGRERLWDVSTHQQVLGAPLTVGAIPIYSVAFSPDGRTIASADADGSARLWDRDMYRLIRPFFAASHGSVNAVAFSRDGKTLATAGADGKARLWDVATHREKGTALTVSASAVRSVAFSPDGKTLATAGADGKARLWDVATHREKGAPLTAGPTAAPLTAVTFSRDGKTLVTAGADGAARLWDVATQRQRGDPFSSNLGLESVAFRPGDGKTFATGGDDGTVRLWDARALHRFQAGRSSAPLAFSSQVYSVAFSPNGKTLAAGGADGKARLFDVATGRPVGSPLTAGHGRVTDVAFTPDGRTLATTNSDGQTRLWNVFLPPDLVSQVCSITNGPMTPHQWKTFIPHQPYKRVC